LSGAWVQIDTDKAQRLNPESPPIFGGAVRSTEILGFAPHPDSQPVSPNPCIIRKKRLISVLEFKS